MPMADWRVFVESVRASLTPGLLAALSVVALSATALSVLVAPLILRRLPSDYFTRKSDRLTRRSVKAFAVGILRNFIAALLLLVGLALLSLPGPGVVTILLALGISDLPLRLRLFRWIMRQPRLRTSVDRLRIRAGQKPLEF
jgi:Na+/proline symporter